MLDFEALSLSPFASGAMLGFDNRTSFVADPFREPTALLDTLLSPVGTLADKLRIALLARCGCSSSAATAQDQSTLDSCKPEVFLSSALTPSFDPFSPVFSWKLN